MVVRPSGDVAFARACHGGCTERADGRKISASATRIQLMAAYFTANTAACGDRSALRLAPRDPLHEPIGPVFCRPSPGALGHPLQFRLVIAHLELQADDHVAH